MIKRLIIYIFLCSIILVGCSENSNNQLDIGENGKKVKYKISELTDWRNITIKTGIYSNVGNGEIVENDNKVFYVNNGIEINSIDKTSKEKKILYQLKEKKDTYCLGAHISLNDEEVFVEYAGSIYKMKLDGEDFCKILSKRELRKKLSPFVININKCFDNHIVNGIQCYKDDIYLFLSTLDIIRISPKNTNSFYRIASDAEMACFYKNKLIYSTYSNKSIYSVDLKTFKKTKIKGQDKSNSISYYGVINVDGELYYIASIPYTSNPAIYSYSENKLIYQFNQKKANVEFVRTSQGSVICEYSDDLGDWDIIYDIRLNREYKIQMPNDYFRTEFMIGDMILYNPLKSDCMKVVRIDVKQ